MVYLYAAEVSGLLDSWEYPEVMAGLPKERQEKIQKCQKKDKRKQSLGAGLLLQYTLEKHGDLGGNAFYNISHSGPLVICAWSEKPVGCDVERIRKAPARVAEHFFSKGEKDYLSKFYGDAYDLEFFRLWTMKESYMKMTREGMRLPLNKFEVRIGEEIEVYREGKLQDCHIKEYEVWGYPIAVCAQDDAFATICCVLL